MSKVVYVAFGANHARAQALYDLAGAIDETPDTYDQAAKLYRQAIRLRPDFANAWVNLGNIHYRKGDVRKAETHYRKALAFDDRSPDANYNLGFLKLEQGHLDVAITHLRIAIEEDPEFADAHFNLAMAYVQCGWPQKAAPHWRIYLGLEPNSTWSDTARRHLRQAGDTATDLYAVNT